jgi:hypothetical protein
MAAIECAEIGASAVEIEGIVHERHGLGRPGRRIHARDIHIWT